MVLGETTGPAGGSSSGGVLRVEVVQEPSRRPASEPLAGLRQADLFDLVRRLRAGDQRAPAARAELLRRGLTEVDLELGRRLFDPDPEVRRQLVRALPALQSVDAAPWLLQLCQDEDPEVRMAALAMTGTTADPRLLDQVEALARQDPDGRIRDLAEQLAQQRDIVGARAGGAARPQPRTPRGPGN
jgi:HEAT repeat protein